MASVQLPGRLDYGAVRNIGAGIMEREKHRAGLKHMESAEARAESAEARAVSAEERAADKYEFDKGQREIEVTEAQRELLSGIMEDAALSGDYETAKATYDRDMSRFGAGLGFPSEVLEAEFTQEEYDGTIARLHERLDEENWARSGEPIIQEGPDGRPQYVQTFINPKTRKVKTVPLPGGAAVTAHDVQRAGKIARAKARGTALGKADTLWDTLAAELSAEARGEIIPMKGKVESTLALTEQILSHPGREIATGLSSLSPTQFVPGTDHYDFVVMMKQARGGIFMEAYQTLKGGGQITELEGQKAEEALARMDTAQSEEEFMRGVRDFQDAVVAGYERTLRTARGSAKDLKAETQKAMDEPLKGAPGGDSGYPTPTQAHLDYLKANPDQADAFKKKFGYLPEGL